MLILSHFCDSAKFNLTLLNLSSDVMDNNLPIISERILNSNRGIVKGRPRAGCSTEAEAEENTVS